MHVDHLPLRRNRPGVCNAPCSCMLWALATSPLPPRLAPSTLLPPHLHLFRRSPLILSSAAGYPPVPLGRQRHAPVHLPSRIARTLPPYAPPPSPLHTPPPALPVPLGRQRHGPVHLHREGFPRGATQPRSQLPHGEPQGGGSQPVAEQQTQVAPHHGTLEGAARSRGRGNGGGNGN